MNFSELFIRKPVMTLLVVITVLFYGLWCYQQLPISDLPSVDSPVITINVNYPGASPETMASTVASPLENQCMQIPGLVSMISSNTEGTTQITLTFDLDRSVDLAAPDVQAAISRSMGNLPGDLPAPPTYTKTNPADKPIIYILVKSKLLTEGELYDIGNKVIGQRISMIEGISAVNIYGAKRSVRIQVDPNKLNNSGVSLAEIAQLLNASTVTVPGGSLDGKKQTYSIEPQGQLFDASEYKDLIIKYVNGAPLRISDVGTVINSTQNDVLRTMYAGKDYPLSKGATVIMATRRGGTNTVKLSQEIIQLLDDIKPQLPSSVDVVVLYSRASSIIDSINDVKFTVEIALVLVVLVIFLFLGRISDTIIPSITLPFSILCTFIVMYAANFSLDNLSLMAVMLAIGFVVDDAIVVLENTVRLVEEGQKPFDAAVNSARQITATVVSMTLSLSIIFAPLVFMGGVVGRTFREFSLTVVVCIICSGIVALTLTPMMCARMLKPADKVKKNFFQNIVDSSMARVIKGYGVTLKFVLKHVWLSVAMWVACLFGTYWFFMQLPQTFLPIGDSGLLIGGIIVPLDTSSKKMQAFQDEINQKLLVDPNVDYFLTVTGSNPGADQSMGFMVVRLVEPSKRKLMSDPKKKNPNIDEVNHEICGNLMMHAADPLGFAILSPMPVLQLSLGGEDTAQGCKYSYRVSGADRDDVYQAAQKLTGAMYGIPGISASSIQSTVKLDMPQLKVKILRDRASTFGITASDIEEALANAFAQGR
ncbi:MAG: hypothetical protein A2X49_07190, partial [Lentisphaerae bacterium GWF2_52_8]